MTLKEHFLISKRAIKLCFTLERRFTLCLFSGAFLAAITPYIPVYFSAKLVDVLYAQANRGVLIEYVLLTVGLVFLVKLLSVWIAANKETAESAMYRNENWMYSQKAMEMAYEATEDSNVTKLRYRIQGESMTGFNRYYLYHCMEQFVKDGTQIIASIALTTSFFALPTLTTFWKLALIAGLILTLFVSVKSAALMGQLNEKFWSFCVGMNVTSEKFKQYINDYSAGKDIRLYGMKQFLSTGKMKADAAFYDMAMKQSGKRALYSTPVVVLEHCFQFLVYGILIVTALAGEISVGDITRYMTCIMMMVGATADLAGVMKLSLNNHHYMKRYFSYFDIPNNMYKGTLTVEKRDDNEYFIEFKDVSFRYPGSNQYALHHINLTFKVGEKLAVVGMNGSGKTTFIKLLCRLYDPSEGEILLNGVNIQKYDYDEYMSIFSVVFQDFQLFPFKLGEVVASDKHYDVEKVRECLDKVGFTRRMEELPEGENTFLYKKYDKTGVEISGGEAQKIALARALYKDAPFILLDEPTAALDPISEYDVYKNFNHISGDKTAVYISHRLASCRFCDMIAVFHEGEIIQIGKHEELITDLEGKYHELWEAQAQYYAS